MCQGACEEVIERLEGIGPLFPRVGPVRESNSGLATSAFIYCTMLLALYFF